MKTHGLRFPDKISVDTNSLLVTLVSQASAGDFLGRLPSWKTFTCILISSSEKCKNPALAEEVYLIGREQEFVVESEIIADIAKQFVQENIIPESLKFAPWVKEGFTVG